MKISCISYVNGDFVSSSEASIPIDGHNLGVIRGIRIFTTAVSKKNKLKELDAHVDRLIHSAEQVNLALGFNKEELKEILKEVLKQNRSINKSVDFIFKVMLVGKERLSDPASLYVTVSLKPVLEDRLYTEGACLLSLEFERELAEIKFANYVYATLMLEQFRKQQRKLDGVMYVSKDGHPVILEGDTFSLFFVKGKNVVTVPAHGQILKGITRKIALDELKKMTSLEVHEKEVLLSDLGDFDEIFLTSSIRGIMPVYKVDDLVFPFREKGVTSRLMKVYRGRR